MIRIPPGKSILVLTLIALVTGSGVALSPSAPRASLVVWCFDASSAQTYRGRLGNEFQSRTHLSTDIQVLSQQALDIRLISLFMSRAAGPEVPDVCEIEISSVGKFLRAPPEDVGLLPLNDFLANSGQATRILPSRLSLWSRPDPKTGKAIVFGIPGDVHPVMLVYRKDLFDQAGVDPSACKTWSEFREASLKLQAYSATHGNASLRALSGSEYSPDTLTILLLQRHVNLVDAQNVSHLDDQKVAQTVAEYASLFDGTNAIAVDAPASDQAWARQLAEGHAAASLAPDWKIAVLRNFDPELSGKFRLMPLPKFADDDTPTSTWGGTMIGIPRNAVRPKDAWNLLQFLHLSPEAIAARAAHAPEILPPLPDVWDQPQFHQPDPFFGGQKIMELSIDLARQIPERDVTAFNLEAQIALGEVLRRAVADHADSRLCAVWLHEAQDQLQRRIRFGELLQ